MPRLAVALVARADEVRHVDGDVGLGGIGEEQDAQAVVEAVLGDALDGGPTGDAFRRLLLGERHAGGRQHEQGEAVSSPEDPFFLQALRFYTILRHGPRGNQGKPDGGVEKVPRAECVRKTRSLVGRKRVVAAGMGMLG